MLLTKMGLTSWMLANVVASAIFIHFASWAWLEPNLRGEDVARGGDAAVWMFGALPVIAISILANLIWFAFVSRERMKSGAVWPIPIITVVSAIWISALVVDHLRGLGF